MAINCTISKSHLVLLIFNSTPWCDQTYVIALIQFTQTCQCSLVIMRVVLLYVLTIILLMTTLFYYIKIVPRKNKQFSYNIYHVGYHLEHIKKSVSANVIEEIVEVGEVEVDMNARQRTLKNTCRKYKKVLTRKSAYPYKFRLR